jgi:hypothetical protein
MTATTTAAMATAAITTTIADRFDRSPAPRRPAGAASFPVQIGVRPHDRPCHLA